MAYVAKAPIPKTEPCLRGVCGNPPEPVPPQVPIMLLEPTKARHAGRSPCIPRKHAIFLRVHKQARPNPTWWRRIARNRYQSPRPLSVPLSGLKLGYPLELMSRAAYEPYRAPGAPDIDPLSGRPRTFWRQMLLTFGPVAPITPARTAVKTIQCLPAPLLLAPTAFGGAILLFLIRPVFLCFLVRHTRILVLTALRGLDCFLWNQRILATAAPARSE